MFESRFPEGVPSLVECESLAIAGDVRFSRGVAIKGNVVINNRRDEQVVVEDGAIIDRDLLF